VRESKPRKTYSAQFIRHRETRILILRRWQVRRHCLVARTPFAFTPPSQQARSRGVGGVPLEGMLGHISYAPRIARRIQLQWMEIDEIPVRHTQVPSVLCQDLHEEQQTTVYRILPSYRFAWQRRPGC